MHEASIAENILQIAVRAAQNSGLSRIRGIVLEIGELSGVAIPALEFAIPIVFKGSIAEGAEITVLSPALLLFCQDCENEYLAELEDMRCPACDGEKFEVVQGRELMVKSITGE